MDHHDHMGHGGMDMSPGQPMCNMNMLFTWDTTNLCIIFHWWRVGGVFSLIVSLLAVVVLTAGYEVVREASRRYEANSSEYANSLPTDDDDSPSGGRRSFLWSGKDAGQQQQKVRIIKALLYAVQVFYSFFIMLLFMTYNGWVMLAVAIGAFLGYLGFGASTSTKSVACH